MSSPESEARNARTLLAVGVTLGIIGALIVLTIVFVAFRRQRRDSSHSNDTTSFRHAAIDRNHAALHIIPFGSPLGEGPKFVHTPGADMRIAKRRSDGGWEFEDPRAPFAPLGVGELSPVSTTFPRSRETLLLNYGGGGYGSSKKARMAYEDCLPPHTPPPPAYIREDRV